MFKKLYIDDVRPCPNGFDIARSSKEAQDYVLSNGIPNYISFDHDLGGEDTAMIFVHWLSDYIMFNELKLPNGFDFVVHSANPVGAENIVSYVNQMIRFFKEK